MQEIMIFFFLTIFHWFVRRKYILLASVNLIKLLTYIKYDKKHYDFNMLYE